MRWDILQISSAVNIGLLTAAVLCTIASREMRAESMPIPDRQSHITDPANILPADERALLNRDLARLRNPELSVLIIRTTGAEPLPAYAARAAKSWNRISAKAGGGILLVVARDDRRANIYVGKKFQRALNEKTTARIVEKSILPLLRDGDFNTGVYLGVKEIRSALAAQPGSLAALRRWVSEIKWSGKFSLMAGVLAIACLLFLFFYFLGPGLFGKTRGTTKSRPIDPNIDRFGDL